MSDSKYPGVSFLSGCDTPCGHRKTQKAHCGLGENTLQWRTLTRVCVYVIKTKMRGFPSVRTSKLLFLLEVYICRSHLKAHKHHGTLFNGPSDRCLHTSWRLQQKCLQNVLKLHRGSYVTVSLMWGTKETRSSQYLFFCTRVIWTAVQLHTVPHN